jgi:hypothetical protein
MGRSSTAQLQIPFSEDPIDHCKPETQAVSREVTVASKVENEQGPSFFPSFWLPAPLVNEQVTLS